MARYIIRRVLWGIVLLILVSLLTFLVFYVFPAANPAALRAGRQPSPKVIAYITHALGLDKPIYTQFWDYMKGIVLHFNFGYSYYSQQSVLSLITNRLPATISLTVGAVVLWVAIGVPVGIISAVMRGRPLSRRARMTMLLAWLVAVLIPVILFVVATPDWGGVFLLLWALTGVVILVVFFAKKGDFLDRSAMGTSLAFVSMPVFWLGLIVIFLFASDIGKFPILPGANSYVGLTVDPWEWFKSLLLPWFVLAATQAAIYSRLLRGSLLEVMGEDYIRTARAKGVRESRVIWHHGVRSAITPVVTVIGIDIAALLGGAVLTETVFDIPGIGRLNYDAIVNTDIPIVQGTVLLAAMFIVVANIIVDISYAYLDPRVRYS